MADDKKKEFRGHVISMAISIAAGYFTAQVKINELFSLPSYAYTSLLILIGIVILYRILAFIRFTIVSYRDSKQEEYMAMPFFISSEEVNLYRTQPEMYDGLEWLIETQRYDGNLNDITGPFCPKDHTKMISRKTFFGRYEYECPTCLLKVRKDYDSYTLESRLRRVTEAKINSVKEQRILKQNESYSKVTKKITSGIKNMWDDA